MGEMYAHLKFAIGAFVNIFLNRVTTFMITQNSMRILFLRLLQLLQKLYETCI
jgi:hypothetical protein